MRTPEADRFQHEVEVPDPPLSPKGRQRYWDETVFEAVAELRKRLRGQDSDEARRAMEMILDLEKTRIRHAAKVSGTGVPNLPDLEDDWGNPVKSIPITTAKAVFAATSGAEPASPAPEVAAKTVPPIAPPEEPAPSRSRFVDAEPASSRTPARPLPNPPRIPGVTACFSDRDDDWTRDQDRCHIPDDDERAAAPFALPPPEPRVWC